MTDIANQVFPHPTDPTPSLPEKPELVTLDSLIIGELDSEKRVEIVNSIMSMSVSLTANAVSSINFKVYDPNFRMHDNNYFLIQRGVEFNGMMYEIANVTLQHGSRDIVNVTARNMKMQRIRREKGQKSFGAISPTALARLTAQKHGLGFVGETSPVNGSIVRKKDKDTDESTYDVLKRLARDLKFMFFESKDYMFFASEDFIVDIQGQIRMYVPGRDAEIDPVTGGYVTDVVFPLNLNLQRDENAKKPATFNSNAHTNATTQQIYPGLGASFWKVVEIFEDNELVTSYEEPFPNYEDLFMIDKVNYTMTPNTPTAISGTSVRERADMVCSARTFQAGSEGVCVTRIQHAVGLTGAELTGKFDKNTVTAVTNFQKANIARFSDLPQFQDDNWKDIMNLGVVGRVTWEWIKAVNMSEVTVPVPIIRGADADDDILWGQGRGGEAAS